MKCSRDMWSAALALLKHATMAASSMPVLTEIQVSAEGDRARLQGTDLTLEMSIAFAADGDLAPCAVPLATIAKLTNASKRTRGEPIEITNTDAGLRLAIGGRTFEIAAGVPERPAGWASTDWSGATVQSHGSADLSSALRYVAAASSRDPTREHLCGVYLGENHAVACDGHRMNVARDIESFPGGPVTLPNGTVAALLAAIKAADAPWIMARHRPAGEPPLVQFHVEGVLFEVLLTSRCIDGAFPPWRQVCPHHEQTFAVESEPWRASLTTASKLAGTAGAWIAAHRECRVELADLFSEVLPLAWKPPTEARVCCNPRYLLDASAGAEELVRIEYGIGDTLEPVLVRPADDRFGVVMPMGQ